MVHVELVHNFITSHTAIAAPLVEGPIVMIIYLQYANNKEASQSRAPVCTDCVCCKIETESTQKTSGKSSPLKCVLNGAPCGVLEKKPPTGSSMRSTAAPKSAGASTARTVDYKIPIQQRVSISVFYLQFESAPY